MTMTFACLMVVGMICFATATGIDPFLNHAHISFYRILVPDIKYVFNCICFPTCLLEAYEITSTVKSKISAILFQAFCNCVVQFVYMQFISFHAAALHFL